MQKGSAAIIFIIAILIASATIISGSIFTKQFIHKKQDSAIQNITPTPTSNNLVDTTVHILDIEIKTKCRQEGVKAVTDADLKYTQAVVTYDKCTKDLSENKSPEASKATTQGNNCQNKTNQMTKLCNDQVNKNLISVDQFEACINQVTAEFKTCLQSANKLYMTGVQSEMNQLEICNQALDQAIKEKEDLEKRFCIISLEQQ